MYKLLPAMYGQTQPIAVINIENGTCIPFDPENTDYQAYLAWLAEGNTPLPPEGN